MTSDVFVLVGASRLATHHRWAAREAQIRLLTGSTVGAAEGRHRVKRAQIVSTLGDTLDPEAIDCDLIATSGGWNPNVHLHSQSGAKPAYDESILSFVPGEPRQAETSVGAAGGSSAVVSWFGSYPAEPIRGHYVSKGFDPERLRDGQVHPAAFASTLSGVRISIQADSLQAIGKTESFRKTLLADARTTAAVLALQEQADPDLMVAYYAGIDVVQHVTWRHMAPGSGAFPQDGQHSLRCEVTNTHLGNANKSPGLNIMNVAHPTGSTEAACGVRLRGTMGGGCAGLAPDQSV